MSAITSGPDAVPGTKSGYGDGEEWDKDHPELEGPYGTKSPDDPGKPNDSDTPEYGQTKDERSIIITPFNNEDDLDLVMANSVIQERMRYVNDYWSFTRNTLGNNSFWGDATKNGLPYLRRTFDVYKAQHPEDSNAVKPEPKTNGIGQFVSGSGNTVNITVNDYSE